jgi:hypothetical protein
LKLIKLDRVNCIGRSISDEGRNIFGCAFDLGKLGHPVWQIGGFHFFLCDTNNRLRVICESKQGCQMVCFLTKKSEFGYTLESLAMYVRCWSILRPFGLFYSHLIYVMPTCYNVLYISPVLVFCSKKNLATLSQGPRSRFSENHSKHKK